MPPRIVPPCLPKDGCIGIVAPCSPVNEAALERGRDALHQMGFRTVLGKYVLDRRGHQAGLLADRAADLHEMFRRDDVDAVLCARGGSGSIRLLEYLDWDLIARHPKPFLGYSDVTSLHLGMAARTGLVSFFAPMVTSDFAQQVDDLCRETLLRLVCQPEPMGAYDDPRILDTKVVCEGIAEGRLVGGTLSLLAAGLGTPYALDTEGAILFMEDIHESPAQIERFLTQFHLAGKLQSAAGFILGSLRWDPDEEERARFLSFEQVVADLLIPLGKPCLMGWPSGHLPSPLTLPLGVQVCLDAGERRLTILEPAVR